jgi:Reverse transcriptase (RNA-dependent DNA polymerase)
MPHDPTLPDEPKDPPPRAAEDGNLPRSITLTVDRRRAFRVILEPSAWEELRSALESGGLWSRRGRILKSVVVGGDLGRWSPRPYLPPGGGAWSDTILELHPQTGTTPFDRLIADAVGLFRRHDAEDRPEFDRAVAEAWKSEHRAAVDAHPLGAGALPRPFPPYDARLASIPKKRPGDYRIIAVPTKEQLVAGRSLLPYLHARLDPTLPLHGFVPGRNPVTNAKAHLGFAWSLAMDLEDFFDHVTAGKLVAAGVPRSIASLVTDREGIARQGYATSPAAANLAFQPVDRLILAALAEECPGGVYTRYADDLTISVQELGALRRLGKRIEGIVLAAGFRVSGRKTHLLSAKAGRRVITGVAVGAGDFAATRAARRRLRAAEHRGNRPQAAGLREWTRLKEPRSKTP